MRWSRLIVAGSVLCLSIIGFSTALGQFPGGGKKGGFGGGGASPFGGGGGNPFGGGGKKGGFGGGMMGDPGYMFDALAKGRPFFLISETRSLNKPLTDFAQERGITNGQITRDQFLQFNEQMKAKVSAFGNAGGGAGGPGGFGKPPGGMFNAAPNIAPGGNSEAPQFGGAAPDFMRQRGGGGGMDVLQWADTEFRRNDNNSDSFLNLSEMPEALRQDLGRWDTNRDELIEINEFRLFFIARLQNGGDRGGNANPVTIIIEEDLDKRPTVLRAGKLPKELKWLSDIDLDKDGQLALWEWRKAGKEIGDFGDYDRNDDGFITPEEALRFMAASRGGRGDSTASLAGNEDGESSSAPRSPFGQGRTFGAGDAGGGGMFNRFSKDKSAGDENPWIKKMQNNGKQKGKKGFGFGGQ